jgi:hypothetical protein
LKGGIFDMKFETKMNIYTTLFNSIIFGVVFTVAGGLLTTGAVDWPNFFITLLVGMTVGFIVGVVIPMGKLGFALGSKIAKPGTFFAKLIMNTVIVVVMLVFMCPVLTLFISSGIYGAPVVAVLPHIFDLFIPFFFIAIVIAMISGEFIKKLAMKCAGTPIEKIQEKH